MQYDVYYSPNYNPYPVVGKVVIIHATRSGHPMNPSEYQGTLNYMRTPGTTASHWVIGRQAQKGRVVSDEFQAWHAGTDNPFCWGIELEQAVESDGFTPEQIDALVEVCRTVYPHIPARHAATSRDAWGGYIGHQETAQGKSYGKTDPGYLFPWTDFLRRLQPMPVTPDGIGVVLDDGTDVGNVYTPPPGRAIAGIGIHLTDGSVKGIYP